MEVEFAGEMVTERFVKVVARGPGGGLVAESKGVIARMLVGEAWFRNHDAAAAGVAGVGRGS